MPIAARPPAPAPVAVASETWISYNLYTVAHDTALRTVVAPAVTELRRHRLLSGFFFVRYFDDRGSHLRIRLCVDPHRLPEVDERFVEAVAARLRGHPEAVSAAEARDPLDVALRPSEIELEVDRYGGPDSHLQSLRFFGISSVCSLDFVHQHHASRAVRRLVLAISNLLGQALGFARSEEELLALVDYFSGWRQTMATVIAGADEAFDRHPTSWCGVFRDAVSRAGGEPAAPGTPGALVLASRTLSDATAGLPADARLELARSQMHMTANRIGLSNAWESYASQLLCRSARAIREGDPAVWAAVERVTARPAAGGGPAAPSLAEQLDRHLSHLVETWS